MASKWGMLRQGVTGSPGVTPRGDGTEVRSPTKSDIPARSASKSPGLGRVRLSRQRSKSDSDPPNSPTVRTSKWNVFRQGSVPKLPQSVPPSGEESQPSKTSKWSVLKKVSSQDVPHSDYTEQEQAQPTDASSGNLKISKWSNLKLRGSPSQAVPPPRTVLSTGSSSPRIHRVRRDPRPVYHSPGTLPIHAPDGAAPKISFRSLVKSMTDLPDIKVTTPPPINTETSQILNGSKASLVIDSKPSPSPRFKRKALPSFLLPKERPPPNDAETSDQKPDVDNYSNVSMLQVDDDMKRKLRQDIDVSMVTLTQPTEMLRSEMFLHEAARKNSVDKVRQLITEKVDVNSRNNLDRTAVQWAAANGNMEVVSLLIHAGADMEAQDKYGMKALLWTAWFGHLDALRVLVNAGANVNGTNKQGLNILHCAAQNNHIEIIHFICDSLENFSLNEEENNGRTAIHLAAEKGHMEALEKLVAAKADIQKKDKNGQTAAHFAAANGHEDVLKQVLLDGIEVDDRDNEGQTPLHLAAADGHIKSVETLLRANADPNSSTGKDMTPLMLAAQTGHTEAVNALLDFGCDVNAQNYQGNTAVHLATLGSHSAIMRSLIDTYAELNIANKRHQTPLHVAVENGLADAVEVLLIAGADIESKEKTGKTALQMASRGSFIGIVDMIIKADRCQRLLEAEGVGTMQCGEVHHCFYGATCNALAGRPSSKLSSCTGASESSVQLKRPNHECTEFMKEILWKLSTKQMKPGDWKRLAHHWKFTDGHIKAIEHQYTGPHSYTEHGYRLLLIWLHGVKKEDSPMKHLYEALVAIDRKDLAENIRRKVNASADKSTSPKFCRVS